MTIEKKVISNKRSPMTTKMGMGDGDDIPSII